MDEQPRQWIRETRHSITISNGEQRIDHEYFREGVCNVWMFVEPLGGWRDVRVSARRTAIDWAQQIKMCWSMIRVTPPRSESRW